MKPANLLLLVAAWMAPSASAGNVLVVGPLPTQIAEIQAAVDAAVDGDVILVKSGTYATFAVPNKTLTIVADTAQVVNVNGAIRVRNLTADRRVVVSGLRATGRFGTGNVVVGNGFFATNCAGSIRVQDCVLQGFGGSTAIPCPSVPRPGAEVEDCSDVAFVRCTITGSSDVRLLWGEPGQSPLSREGRGLVATNSSIAVHETTIVGGAHGHLCNGYEDGTDGGDALVLTSSFLFASNSHAFGGDGQNVYGVNIYAGWGGNGLVTQNPISRAHLLETTARGGGAGSNSGCGLCGSCCDGTAGFDMATYPGTLELLAGNARVLEGSGVVRESTPLALTVVGPPGDTYAVGIARRTGFAWTPARFGVQLLANSPTPTRYLLLGTIPANGSVSTTIQMPPVPSSDPVRRTTCS